MRRTNKKNYNAYEVIQKIKNNVFIPNELKETDYGYLKITYKKGKLSNGIGRWYAYKGLGIQPLCACIRHTICDGLWIDIDQVNSHPTILKTLMDKYNLKSSLLDECLTDRETFLNKVMIEEKCNRDDAKTKVIAVINGNKYSTPLLQELYSQINPSINLIINLPEYKDIYNYVKSQYKENIEGKTISRILQVIENQLLETYIEFFNDKGLINKYNDGYELVLIFDGFQLRFNEAINDDLLNECRLYSYEKTGYDIELKIKPFNNILDLPDDYNLDTYDDLLNLIDYYEFGLNNYIEKLNKEINYAIGSIGSHASISSISKEIFKDTIVYDEDCSSWFYCNTNNIWNKSKSSYIYKGLLKTIIYKLFVNTASHYNKLVLSEQDEAKKEMLVKKSGVSLNISLKLHNISYIDYIVKMGMIDFNYPKFYEKKIDSYGNLYAFKNKVFDCKTCEIRQIKPTDYIMNNCGYDYPEYIDDDLKEVIENYYKTIYPNQEVRDYMWFNDSLTINGERTTQSFVIHTGSGSNSKSTKINMIKSILGDYFLEVNAETFTKPIKSANATSELYKAKGTRLIFFNEPDNDGDNKLQVPLLKKLADGYKATHKARDLYATAVDFPIFFRVECACNNKPVLSSCDGGIGRRIRVVNYPVKFIAEPDKNNEFQALLNPEMNELLTSNAIRNTYIRLLIDYFINFSSKIKIEKIPNKIKDDSLDYIDDSNPVLSFIMDKYIITNNTKDRIRTSELFTEFKYKNSEFKMTSAKFKDNMMSISGIEYKKSDGNMYFTGLKVKDEFISN